MDQKLTPEHRHLARARRDRINPASQHTLLPTEAPITMPRQSVSRHVRSRTNGTAPGLTLARAMMLVLTLVPAAIFATTLRDALSEDALSFAEMVFLGLCTTCFAWVAFGSAGLLIGLASTVTGRHPDTLKLASPASALWTKTALLYPVYHEDPARICAGIEVLAKDLARAGRQNSFEIFILSDTRTGPQLDAETTAFDLLHKKLAGLMPVYYRNRPDNTGKKAGNIEDWVKRFGRKYDHFIIFDADSTMSASTVTTLSATMERQPNAGLIQTVPRLCGGVTLFSLLQQFSAAAYGRIFASGVAAWQSTQGNYWGHNAIIRTKAFAGAAALPELPGAAPFGGTIQSHDFVEAAFLCRAGWEVHLVPSLKGSYEGTPPTLVEFSIRDRRWMQGNLQHVRLLTAKGLPLLSRTHLATGAFAYLAAPLWALSLALGIWITYASQGHVPQYFTGARTLFPSWPTTFDPQLALMLFAATMGWLLLPKLLVLVYLAGRNITKPVKAAQVFVGGLFEMIASVLIAPILMISQSRALLSILVGHDSGWKTQSRDADPDSWRRVAGVFKWQLACGLALAAISTMISTHLVIWMLPIIVGLLLAMLVALLTARIPGDMTKALLHTEDGSDLSRVFAPIEAKYAQWQHRLERD